MKLISYALFCVLIQISTSSIAEFDLDKRIRYFGTKCVEAPQNNKLILIDNTDLLSQSQKQFVIDNFINTISWSDEGDRISIVSLYKDPVALMPVVSICAPKPINKIDEMLDPIAKIKAENLMFRKTLQGAFVKLTLESEEVDNTLLMEAITEIYRSARYKFKSGKKRQLILVSDLYQHSDLLSFFRECHKPIFSPKKPLTCPSIEKVVGDNMRFKHYLEAAKPKLTQSDHIKIFYLNVNDRVDRSAEQWWKGYFELSGLNTETQLEIIPELQN